MAEKSPALAEPHIQATLLAEAVGSASVGFLVWDEERHYVAANARACELLGCTLEQLLGTVVGERTVDGAAIVRQVVRGLNRSGRLTVERFDGETIELEYLTFETKTATLPHIGSIVWPAPEDA